MTNNILQIRTHSLEETHVLGRQMGLHMQAGTVIALTGDLGSGKTSFVQGLARGLDVPRDYYVTSPTYTLINEYPGRCPLFHVDLYRLDNSVDFEEIGLYEILHEQGIVAIEWADRLHKDVLAEHLAVHLEILDDDSRKIHIASNGIEADDLAAKLELQYFANERPMGIKVECYAGYRAEETPRRIIMGTNKIEVREVLDQWLAPDHRYFKIMGHDNSICIIRHDIVSWKWELTFYKDKAASFILP